ncbi:MAG: AMP-binding protein [Halanaerobiales bacterium]|nr:AMP-binding protein [Halanaerobiales bacterium]
MKLTEKEFMSREKIYQMQEALVLQTINYTYQNSKFYRELYDNQDIEKADIKSLEDIRKLPFTNKKDIQERNMDFFCVSNSQIVDIVSTSGTTGMPVLFPLTRSDLDRLALNEALSFSCINANNEDLFQIMVNMGNLFMAGLAYYLGLVKLGATTYRIGAGKTQRQLFLLNSLRPNGLVSVPSFLLKLREAGIEQGIDVKEFGLEKIVLIGETILDTDLKLNRLGKKIEDLWGVRPFSSFGSTEMAGSFAECTAHQGLHNHPELLYFEIIDENEELVPDGNLGELVITILQNQGMPLVRYKTGDITFKITGKCDCGRNTERLGPVIGRKHQMIKCKGTKLYPGQIEKALMAFDEINNYIIEVSTGKEFSDEIKLKLGVKKSDESLIKKVKEYVNALGRVTPEIELYDAHIIEELLFKGDSRKAKTFIDLRDKIDY